MAEGSPTRALALKERREQTIGVLIEQFAADNLTVEEFEERIDRAHRAVSDTDLTALTSDLPALAASAPEQSAKSASAPVSAQAVNPMPRDRQVVVALMGGVERKGSWTPARRVIAVAMMGGMELDFREAVLPDGVTEVWLLAVWGGVDIIVPPWMRVDSGGIAILGGFGDSPSAKDVDPNGPVIRLNGLALMGGVDIQVRYPGESAREAKRRLRDERKALRKRQRLLGRRPRNDTTW